MPRHTRYNWPDLFAKFDDSNLSQTAFCKEHNLNPKYFNLKLFKRKAQQSVAFAEVIVQPEQVSSKGLVLEVGNCKVHCPTSMPIPSFVSLVKALA